MPVVLGFVACAVAGQVSSQDEPRPSPLHDDREYSWLEDDLLEPIGEGPTQQQFAERARTEFCRTIRARIEVGCEDPEGPRIVDVTVGEGPSGPFAVHVVRLRARTSELAIEMVYLHVQGGTVDLFELLDESYLTGQGGVSHDAGFTTLTFVGDTNQALVAAFGRHGNDEDMGICERDGDYHERVIVCAARPSGPSCASVVTRSLVYEERERPCDGERYRTISRFRGYAMRWRLAPEGLVFSREPRSPQRPPRRFVGLVPFDRLVDDASLRWPAREP